MRICIFLEELPLSHQRLTSSHPSKSRMKLILKTIMKNAK
jgi:hypothetical protein